MRLAILLPGYLDSPDYLHMQTFDKGLSDLGYKVERPDIGRLWETGKADNYSVTNSIKEIQEIINKYQTETLEDVLLVGHSRGAFLAIIAGNRIKEVTKIVALCPPPDIKSSVHKWGNREPRVSKRELPNEPSVIREFSVPFSYVEDSLKYSATDEVKSLKKPLMVFIALDDTVVPPELAEKIVQSANNPYVVRRKGMGHDFRKSQEECNLVMREIEKFLSQWALSSDTS